MTQQQIRGIIFDMDGVISDTAVLHYQAWKRVADEEGLAFSRADYARMSGTTRTENLRLFTEGLDVDEATKQNWMVRKNDYFLEMIEQMQPGDAMPGIERLIHEAKAAGLKVAVGSSSRNARPVLTRLGLIDEFDVIGDGHTVVRSKPASDLFMWVAGALGLHPWEILVIEDSPKGVTAANNGGFNVVGVGHLDLSAASAQYDTLAAVSLMELIAQLQPA